MWHRLRNRTLSGLIPEMMNENEPFSGIGASGIGGYLSCPSFLCMQCAS